MHEWEPISSFTEPLPGDYLRYYDLRDNLVGSGVIIKVVIHNRRPLTESHYLLKNMTTKRSWKVHFDRYSKFEFMRHKTKNRAFGDYLRSLLNNDS